MGDLTGYGHRARLVRGVLLAGALVAALALATGCGGGDGDGDAGSGARSASTHTGPVRYAHARGLFRKMCAGCHALADAGAHGHRMNIDRHFVQPANPYEYVRSVVTRGYPGMPYWRGRLSRADIESLTQYIVAVAGKHTSGDGRQATALTPIEDRVLVQPHPYTHGKGLFKELCAGCHALADADAHGDMSDLDQAYRGGTLTKQALLVALEGRGGMPKWTRALTPDEIDALLVYLPAVAGKSS